MCNVTISGINVNCYNGLKLDFNSGLKFVTTLNAELIIKSNNDSKLKEILNASLVTIDGQWTLFAAKRKYPKINDFIKISGSDYIYDVIEIASKENKKVLLLGSTQDNNERAVNNLKEKYSYDKIVGFSPSFSNYPFENFFLKSIEEKIKNYEPDIIITAFGVPKQEYWAYENMKMLNNYNVKYIMFFGGAIDIVSGKFTKAPKIIQKFGLESLYRLIQDPKRIRRELTKLHFFSLIIKNKI